MRTAMVKCGKEENFGPAIIHKGVLYPFKNQRTVDQIMEKGEEYFEGIIRFGGIPWRGEWTEAP